MSQDAKRRIGLPWYRREDYAAIREIMTDSHILAPTYDQWLAAAENNEQVGRDAGLDVVRVFIEPEAFQSWCAANGRQPDSAARRDYAAAAAV